MKRTEYEERKRRLEEQLRAGVELLEAAYRQQMRALEMVWMTGSQEDLPIPPRPPAGRQKPPAPPAAPKLPQRRGGDLSEEVAALLPALPEVFDRNDICKALGYQPDRTNLYRVLRDLGSIGVLTIVKPGEGRKPTQYRKTGSNLPPRDE